MRSADPRAGVRAGRPGRTAAGLGLLLALAAALAAAAPADPCGDGSAVLAGRGAGALGPAGPSEALLRFRLSAPTRVWAEAAGLRGLASGDRDTAPEVFLDDSYLGPLLSEQGEDWRSPRALRLDAGEHTLLLRRAQESGGPRLAWSSLRVLSDAPCPPFAPRAEAPRSRSCAALTEHPHWPPRLHGRDLVLSVLGGRLVSSGPLVDVRAGEVWRARVKIPAGADGQPRPIDAVIAFPGKGDARLLFELDPKAQGPVDAQGYTPGAWEPMSVSLCEGALWIRMAHFPPLAQLWVGESVRLEVAARDVEVQLAPPEAPHPTQR